MDERAFQTPRLESEFDREWPRPLLVPNQSHIRRADRYTKRIYSLGLVHGGFRKCRWRLAALHRSDSLETLVEGEGRADFQHYSNHRRLARSFVWSFVTAVRLDSTERLHSSSRTAGKVR